MSRRLVILCFLLVGFFVGHANPRETALDSSQSSARNNFPQTVRVRLWYLHPPQELHFTAEPGQARLRRCGSCKAMLVSSSVLRAMGSSIRVDHERSSTPQVRIDGSYQMSAAGAPPFHGDFPVEIRASGGRLLITALMPMEEYVAGVLAGETGNFHSDEALKAMAVAARTFAVHFGSRHQLEGFDFCDTTHCQDLRIAGINNHLREIASATAGEVLWYDGEPAATYYHANCGGTTEDGKYLLGNNEPRAPFLVQHSDQYCVRNGSTQWSSEISKRELQRALEEDGIRIPGTLRSVAVIYRTASGRVEFLSITGSNAVTVAGVAFRTAVGRYVGWERLKSNWYDVSDDGDRIIFHGRGSGHGVGLCQVGAEVMGEEGHTYREILSFYYPGTRLGVSAQGTAWQRLANEDVQLLTTRPDRDRPLLALATRIMQESEERTGLIYRYTPQLKVYPTLSAFRDATGEPGWVAASTRGRTIQMQPPDTLRDAGALESTLRHELLHILVESYSRTGTPLWFREGLVLYFAGQEDPVGKVSEFDSGAALEKALRTPASEELLRHAYADARARVQQLAQQHGKDTLLGWLQNGLPQEVTASWSDR